MNRFHWVLLLLAFLSCDLVYARPPELQAIPETLRPWVDWVMQDQDDYICPFLANDFKQKRCAWPGRLSLKIGEESAEFSLDWKVYAESWVPLPGNREHWPQDVRVDQKPAVVMQRNARPVMKLPPGNFQVSGRFFWESIPESLRIPDQLGLIELNVAGSRIEFPRREQGQLWLKDAGIDSAARRRSEDALDIQVFRRIEDDVPFQILTRLQLEVAGEQRELKLRLPLLKEFIPMRLHSPLPARIESDRSLLVQVRPGRWDIDLTTRHERQVTQLSLQRVDPRWPEQELWAFAAHPEIRLVEITNVSPVDAQLSNLPAGWKHLPAYRIRHGETIQFKVLRRGDPQPEPDSLTIKRSLWLDFDGEGYTVNDTIHGKMTASSRLNALPQTHLGKVSLDGANQLITSLPDSKLQGFEVRKGQLNVSADSRISAPIDNINAVGWQQSFQRVQAVLNLPPGWNLIAANGIDNVPDSWLSRWTLLDLFLVLIAALAIGRLWNPVWGLFALVTLALIWHETDAPRFIWLNVLAAIALLRVLPQGRLFTFIRWYRNISCLVLAIALLPFMIQQVRIGLYPQLEMPWRQMSPFAAGQAGRQAAPPPATQELEQDSLPRSVARMKSMADAAVTMAPAPAKAPLFNRIDPKANLQTGPGLPQWRWTEIHLDWNGPVDSSQQIRFWYLSPVMTRLLNFIRALLVAGLGLLVFSTLRTKLSPGVQSVLLWALISPLLLLTNQPAQAEFPDQKLLDELKSRLLAAPDCLPGCAQVQQMDLRIDAQKVALTLDVGLQERNAIPLPGPADQWRPTRVSVDGEPVQGLFQDAQGTLWAVLEAGQTRLALEGPTPPARQFSLALPLNPHRLTVTAEAWRIEGIHKNRSPDAQVHFTRRSSAAEQAETKQLEPGILPPFVRVERTLELGLDWRVRTRVVRVTPKGAPIVLQIPLLPGESVTTADIRVTGGKVLVNLSANQDNLQWRSVLNKSSTIQLQAAATDQWSEIWRADVSPIWHLSSDGIAVVHHQDRQGRWLPEWRPWPGESVQLTVTRPQAVNGRTLTIDRSRIQLSPGKRAQEATLDLTLRSSRGGQHAISLPENAVLQSVTIDGRTQPVRQQGRQVTLPVKPGAQDLRLTWRNASPIVTRLSTPVVDLGTESVNTTLNVQLGQDRWTLFTWGPAVGPAVLFWGVMLVIAFLSLPLGRIKLTPLKSRHWFLLLIGLSQVSVVAAFIVVAWLILLGYRESAAAADRIYFNARQIAIAFLTIISLGVLFAAINQGLLGSPEMQISGNQSSAYRLNWYQDRSPALLPRATVVSLPLVVYRVLMLGWALWLAISLLNWLKWGWRCFAKGGIWQKSAAKKKVLVSSRDSGTES